MLGALFLLRMVADGSSGLGWLRWLTPFGWLEELRPFADNRVLPLLLLAGLAVAVGAIAIALSRQRDLGDGKEPGVVPRQLQSRQHQQTTTGRLRRKGLGHHFFVLRIQYPGRRPA